MNRLAPHPASFSLTDIVRGMWRRKMLVSACLVLGLCAGLAIVAVFDPKYQTEARVLLDNLATPFDQVSGQQGDPRGEPIDERFVASQIAVLSSEDIALRVLRDLDLIGKSQFEPLTDGVGTAKKILVAAGFSDDPRLMTPEQRALKVLSGSLTVYSVPQSNVIAIKYSAGDGETAAAIANALAETYVLSTRERQSGTTGRAREWLSTQIEDLRSKVSASEAAVERFRADKGLLKGQTATLGAQEISELNSQITLAEASASEARARADEISQMLRNKGSVDASAEVLGSPIIQALRQQQIAVQRKISDLSATYLSDHPKMKAARKEADDVERQIRREALKIVDALQGQANVAEARAAALREDLDASKGREGASLQDDVKLKQLEREAAANRTLLETMLVRYADANARQDMSLQPGFARVIQTANAPAAPYFPKVGPTVMLVTLAGLGLGLGLAFLFEILAQASRLNAAAVEAFDRGETQVLQEAAQPREHALPGVEPQFAELRNPFAPPEARTPMPQVVAALPSAATVSSTLGLLTAAQNGEGPAAAIMRIAQAVTELRARSGVKTVCLMTIGGAQEAAFAAIALGRALTSVQAKTMILDADPGRPCVMDFMSLPAGPGLCEIVSGSADFTKVIAADSVSGAHLIRFGLKTDLESRRLVAARLETVLASLSPLFDCILVHAGEASPETPARVKGCKGAIILAPPHRHRDAAAAAATLAQSGIANTLLVRIGQSESDLKLAG